MGGPLGGGRGGGYLRSPANQLDPYAKIMSGKGEWKDMIASAELGHKYPGELLFGFKNILH